MEKYWQSFLDGYYYFDYFWKEISFQTSPVWKNYFWMLIGVSLLFFILELIRPWRADQARFRKDFWLDFFYMFFNFFLFSLIIYNAASNFFVDQFNDFILYTTGFDLQASNPLQHWPLWAVLLTGFIVRDFIQWWVHRLLHSSPQLWEFHKVHHSVEEMGFAAHLRYHWMENVVYRSLEYIPLALLGIGLYDFFFIHIFTLAWGHYNHSNLHVSGTYTAGILIGIITLLTMNYYGDFSFILTVSITLGVAWLGSRLVGPYMKFIFNSPEMHIWHHAYDLPKDRKYGVNYGITLAIWDYMFHTDYVPHEGKDIRLGFPGVETYPKGFFQQITHGLGIRSAGKRHK